MNNYTHCSNKKALNSKKINFPIYKKFALIIIYLSCITAGNLMVWS